VEIIVLNKYYKEIALKTFGNIELYKNFSANIQPGNGKIRIDSDLTGLKNYK
jgi:hypothetical protein